MRQDESRLVLRMVKDFSTWEPFEQALRNQLNLIGIFIRTWLNAHQIFHFFTNPTIPVVHWMTIGVDENQVPNWVEEKPMRINEINSIEEIPEGEIKSLCNKILEPGQRYLFVPFSQHHFPFGHFILGFKDELPDTFLREKVKGTLNVLQHNLKYLLYNHYPITEFTYLPFFRREQSIEAAILFCDVRNSTRVFEIARMTEDERYTDMIIILLQNFLGYASQIISATNIGRIHRFMGDGFLATFGEPFGSDPALDDKKKAKASCSLGILTAKLLVEGFDKLWSKIQKHPLNIKYMGEYNEDIDLRLGVGVNYGKIKFDFFGDNKTKNPQLHEQHRGFCEFMAVGDHVNFADRLCSVANQPVSLINIIYRGYQPRQPRLTAPIIASKTVTHWINECLNQGGKIDPLIDYRADFMHKGKGHPMPGFELWPDCINPDCLLRLLEQVHKNYYYNVMNKEVDAPINKRPKLGEIAEYLRADLDKIYSL